MSTLLSSLIDNLTEINKTKESEDEFIKNMRSMVDSLSTHINTLSEINKKEPKNKIIDNMRSMSALLSSHINDLSEINKKGPENKFIDNIRSMISSLTSLIDNVSKVNKKISLIELTKKFPATYKFCNKDLNKFELLLRKGVYPHEYMDSWERFNETSLQDKESFYSELNKEDITDEECAHAQKVWKIFKIKNLGEYHDLYVQSDTLLLSDVFENFRDKSLDIYQLDPIHFLSAPGLVWQACLKKTGTELELLTDPDMLLTFEDGTRGGMYKVIHRYAKADNKYMKN